MPRNRKQTTPSPKSATDNGNTFNRWTDRATAYARAAVADTKGKTFCKPVRKACQRFLDDLTKQKSAEFQFYYDPVEASRFCEFAEQMPHVEGNWDSANITLEDWQVFIGCNLYGWRRVGSGRRRFTICYIEVARKNAKSTLASIIALYSLCFEKEVGPQVVCAATTGKQARIVFKVAKRMVDKSPRFREALRLTTSMNAIACMHVGGNIEPINAKAESQEGLNPHCAIVDELHLHKSRALFDVLRAARGARKNPLSFYITTAGDNVLGVCYEQRKIVMDILNKLYTMDHYFGIIYTLDLPEPGEKADKGDDPFNPANWIKANPNLNVSIGLDEMADYAKEAKRSPASAGEFKTKRCNIWTTARNGHLNVEKFQQCASAKGFNPDDFRHAEAWGGLDLGSTTDLTAARLAWKIDKKIFTWGKFYMPEDNIAERTKRSGAPYRTWVDHGFITPTPGPVTDYAYIEDDIKEMLSTFNIKAFAYDPWQAAYLVTRLIEAGAPMIEFRQGAKSYHAPMQEVDRCYLDGNLVHEGNPVLVWNASNLVARHDANLNMAPDKDKSFEMIDGIVALYEAVGIMLGGQTPDGGPSVYEQRGIVEISQ